MDSQGFRNWRLSLGLTQKQVGLLFGISEVAIYKRENGKVAISPETVFATRYLLEHPEEVRARLADSNPQPENA